MRPRPGAAIVTAVLTALIVAPAASARHSSHKKAIWGPVSIDGRSAFPLYHRLGAGIYEMGLNWSQVAPTRPARPADPRDPAYRWPPEISAAIREADRYGLRVLLLVQGTPTWANEGRAPNWVPSRPGDLADFAAAAARRYRRVRYWMVWGEPSRQPNFMPLTPETPGKALTATQAGAPRYYARMLDATYAALKRVRRSNVVIGGNTYTTGDISPLNWIRSMRLPNGRRPRMDMYGHNPFTWRRPDLRQSLFRPPTGYADFSDLDALWRWLDRYGYRDSRDGRLRIFISEWLLPTEHPNHEFNFWVTRAVQARWLTAALRIVRRSPRIYTLGWLSLFDDPPRPAGDEVNRGLIDHKGLRKPSFYAYRDG